MRTASLSSRRSRGRKCMKSDAQSRTRSWTRRVRAFPANPPVRTLCSLRGARHTDAKRSKIKDLLDYIQERLDELEEEKEELKQFQVRNRPCASLSLRTPADFLFARQTFDRSRRSLEYCIYQRELQDVGDMLDQIEEERRRDVDNANSKREEYNGREKELSVRSHLRVPSICSSLIPAVLAEPRQPPVDSPRIALDPRDRAPRAQLREARPRPRSLEPRVCRRRRRRRGALRRRAAHERAGSARARRG